MVTAIWDGQEAQGSSSTSFPVDDAGMNEFTPVFSELNQAFRNARPFLLHTDTYSPAAIDAANVARQYRALMDQAEKKRQNILSLESRVKDASMAAKETQRNHVAFINGIAPLDENVDDVRTMAKHMSDYVALQQSVLNAWMRTTAEQLTAMRDETERLNEEAALVREMLIAGAREIVHPPNRPSTEGGEAAATATINLCPVCFEREANTACVPCGHTLCATCSASDPINAAYSRRCPTCRTNVRETVKLFFSV